MCCKLVFLYFIYLSLSLSLFLSLSDLGIGTSMVENDVGVVEINWVVFGLGGAGWVCYYVCVEESNRFVVGGGQVCGRFW